MKMYSNFNYVRYCISNKKDLSYNVFALTNMQINAQCSEYDEDGGRDRGNCGSQISLLSASQIRSGQNRRTSSRTVDTLKTVLPTIIRNKAKTVFVIRH
jgi:hypothetical protein